MSYVTSILSVRPIVLPTSLDGTAAEDVCEHVRLVNAECHHEV